MDQNTQTPLVDSLENTFKSDLQKSGLTPFDIKARLLDITERGACNLQSNINGYVIPYYSYEGKPLPYYRARLFDTEPKYKQIKNSPNHVYYPPNFLETFNNQNKLNLKDTVILITEGEKKAALMCKLGYPTIAFGGIDSWQNKTILLPAGTEFNTMSLNKAIISAKVPDIGYMNQDFDISPFAKGFQDLLDLGLRSKATLVIVYDTDTQLGVKPQVQRAAAKLGHEFRFLGFSMPQIRQLVLTPIPDLDKTALDDFIMSEKGGVDRFHKLLVDMLAKRTSFPRHPNVREYVNKRLQQPKMVRKDIQNVALSIITELDSRGIRMFSKDTGEMYYFDTPSGLLMRAPINASGNDQIQDTDFGKMLYKDFGVSPAADGRIMQWLGAQFSGEDPVEHVRPHRVVARPALGEDIFRYQVSDSKYARISSDSYKTGKLCIKDNGEDGILFESSSVEPMDAELLSTSFTAEVEQCKRNNNKFENRWLNVLKSVRLKELNNHALLISYLYYLSPFIYRWRGTQLPVEMVVGESGSGKSTLCELRLDILSGIPTLRGAPQDLKDWYASISKSGGLHVTDNVQLLDKQLKQRLSDELCRIITEPDPYIEMRKYYTNADLMRIKIDPVMCFTAISQPFMNADLLQRAVILELDKSASGSDVEYESTWKKDQLNVLGGREQWMGHILAVLSKFLDAVEKHWDPKYKAQHRLINLEQSLFILSEHVFGLSGRWIPEHLNKTVAQSVSESDWALEGLCSFAKFKLKEGKTHEPFSANDIADWCLVQQDYTDCAQLNNSRRLGRYMQTHKQMISTIAGMIETRKVNNKSMFIAVKTKYQARKDESDRDIAVD